MRWTFYEFLTGGAKIMGGIGEWHHFFSERAWNLLFNLEKIPKLNERVHDSILKKWPFFLPHPSGYEIKILWVIFLRVDVEHET